MYKNLILACIAVAAFFTFAVLPATASASPRLCETTVGGTTCHTVVPPITIVGTNVGETLMTNSSGSVLTRCTTSVLTGELTKNNETEIEGNVTSATFTGSGSESRCTATFGNSTVTAAVANGLPWCLRATSAMEPDEFQVRGGKCSEASREIRFALDVFGGTECLYSRTTSIPGTFTTDTSGQDATATITKQKFTRISGSTLVCPSEGFLDMSFTIETKDGSTLYFK